MGWEPRLSAQEREMMTVSMIFQVVKTTESMTISGPNLSGSQRPFPLPSLLPEMESILKTWE